MRLEWLEDILAVAETGSFSHAAEKRFLTASAFTRRIRTIEETLGCEIFDRSKKPIVLRRHALNSLPDIRAAVEALNTVRTLLGDPSSATEGRLALICQHTLTATWAPQLVQVFAQRHDINVRIRSGAKNDCLLSLIRRDVEFALTYDQAGEAPGVDAQYGESLVLGLEEFLPVARLADNPKLETALQERRVPVISYPPSIYLGDVQRKALQGGLDASFTIVTVAETGLGLAVAEFVKRGLGVGWLPRSIVAEELATGELVNLDHMLPGFALDVRLTRLRGTRSRGAESFWQIIQENPKVRHAA